MGGPRNDVICMLKTVRQWWLGNHLFVTIVIIVSFSL